MKVVLYLVIFASLLSCSEPSINKDFVRSNWGDEYEIVKNTYNQEKDFVTSEDMISYSIKSLKDTATVMFLFSNDELISGTVKYHTKGDKATKKLYDAYVKKNRDKFGFEIFTGNPKTYEFKVYKQLVWQGDKMQVSLRLEEDKVLINYHGKRNMPIH